MAGRLAGQTINDRLLAARHSIAGQGLAKSVCKATTEEMIGPKKKHLDYLVQCTNEPNVSIPQLANLLIERSQNTNWVVVYKALITVHHMMCYGNERFTQYLASSNSTFQLSNFLDKSGVQGVLSAKTGYDMSPFIRRYARYLNEKAMSYRTVAFDFCKKKGNNEDGALRTMHTDKLLKTLPVLQNQLDALLEFDCSANDLTNGVINMCFMLLFRDLIRLFACYNNGIINLLEKFFDMNKKQCREALDIYKKFLIRMDRVGEFLKVAENIGIDKGDIPDLTKAPSSLLEALEQHLASIEGKKSTSSTPSQSASNQKNVRSAVSALSSISSSFGTVVANGRIDSHANGIDETLKIQALAEEEAAIAQFKTKIQSPSNSSTASSANNPFFTSNGNSSNHVPPAQPTMDLFAANTQQQNPLKPSDDLLQLNNPFADVFAAQPEPVNPIMNAFQIPVMQQPNNVNAWITNGNGYNTQAPVSPQPMPPNGGFVSESNFQSVFGNTEVKTADGTAQPQSFNPFLVEDSVPSLLLDDSPTGSRSRPLQDVISYFQKESAVEQSETVNEHRPSYVVKADDKVSVDASLRAPPPRPPPPVSRRPSSALPEPNPDTANEGSGFDALGGVLQPTSMQGGHHQNVQQINAVNNGQSGVGSSALLTGDLESSLASLAENLSINNRPPPVKEIQWNSPKNGSKVNSSWSPQPMSATTGAGYKPMNQAIANNQPMVQPQMFPAMQPMMGMRPVTGANPLLPQRQVLQPQTNAMGPPQQSLLFH